MFGPEHPIQPTQSENFRARLLKMQEAQHLTVDLLICSWCITVLADKHMVSVLSACLGLVQPEERMSPRACLCKPLCNPCAETVAVLDWSTAIKPCPGTCWSSLQRCSGLLCAQRAGQPMPAHQSLRAHPQGTAPRVLDVILHGASLRAGRSPKDAAPRLGACSFSPRRNVLMMACEIIQRYQISAKSDHRSRTTQRCLENRCSL